MYEQPSAPRVQDWKSSSAAFSPVHMSLQQLRQVVYPFRSLLLSELGARKLKQLQVRMSAGLEEQGYRALETSRIIKRGSDEVLALYYCLPFFSRAALLQPIYSTALHPRSLEEVYARTVKVSSCDMLTSM